MFAAPPDYRLLDENLIRSELTPAQRAKLTAQRKGAYQKAHPETKHGATGRRGKKEPNLGSFAADTAAKRGRSLASVKADATRAKRLGPDLDRITGTSLDKGAELDALAAMPAPERQAIISRAAGGSLATGRVGTVGDPDARGVNRPMVGGNLRQPKLAFGYGLDQLD